MALFYMVIFGWMLNSRWKKLSRGKRQKLWIALILYIGIMIMYELAVERIDGWEYGIPMNDDTGWIFRAATAFHNGEPISAMATLIQSYDPYSRALSINTLGQYFVYFFSKARSHDPHDKRRF